MTRASLSSRFRSSPRLPFIYRSKKSVSLRRHHTLILALFAIFTLGNASAQQTITYTNGENDGAAITITAPSNPTILTIASGTATQSGSISESGVSGNVDINGAGTLILSGTDSYSGTTLVTSGTLEAGSTSAISAQSAFTVNGTLDLHGYNNTVASLAGTGIVTDSSPSVNAVLTVGTAGSTAVTTFSGSIQDTGNGLIGLDVGGGTLVLTGTNLFHGGTTINDGTLELAAKGFLGVQQVNNGVTLTNSGELLTDEAQIDPTSGLITINGSGTLAAVNGTEGVYYSTIEGGALTVGDANNGGLVVLDDTIQDGASPTSLNVVNGTVYEYGLNTYTGGTKVSSATLGIINDYSLGAATNSLTLSGGAELLTFSSVYDPSFSTTRTINISGSATLAAVTGSTATYGGSISGGTVIIGDGTNDGTIVFSNTATVTGDLGSNGSGGGDGSLAVTVSANSVLTNHGTITGGGGGSALNGGAGGNGAMAVILDTGANLVNTGTITGGIGGVGGGGGIGYLGGTGGTGGGGAVAVTLNGSASLTNDGTIAGGNGGSGGDSNQDAGVGGNGGTAVALSASAKLSNSGTIAGGNGGNGGDSIVYNGDSGGQGGNGGLAMTQGANSTFVNNHSIVGGSGGNGGAGAFDGGSGGEGSLGMAVNTGASLTNNGSIMGGNGGNGGGGNYGFGDSGGYGTSGGGALTLAMSASLTNNGSITGGTGGNGGVGTNFGGTAGSGGVAVTLGSNTTLINNSNGVITGGSGGSGGNASSGNTNVGGSGNNGGGAVTLATGSSLTNHGSITGGNGGGGGSGGNVYYGGGPGSGGSGGVAVMMNSGTSLTNTGSITGGNATLGNGYLAGPGGAAVTGSGDDMVIDSGNITAGNGYYGEETAEANAINFSGGGNTLMLQSGFNITGNVISSGGDTLALGGTSNSSFDVSNIGPYEQYTTGLQYEGFTNYLKTGTSTWTLKNSTYAVTPWNISQGTLAISSDGSLGDASGTLTFSGGTLQTTATITSSRNVVLSAGLGTFNTDGNSATFAGTISGVGGLTLNDSKKTGTLILTGNSTYAGGTTVTSGTLLANGSSSTGTGPVTVASGAALGGTGVIKTSGVTSGAAVTIASAATLNQSIAGGGLGTSTLTLDLHNNGSTASVDLLQGAKFAFSLSASGISDEVIVTGGTLNLNSQKFSDFTFTTLGGFIGHGTYTLFSTDASGDILGSLGTASGTIDGYDATLSIVNSQDLELTIEAAPEPSTEALLLGGFVLLVAVHRRSRRVA